jgi:hypothetical protein
MWIEYNKIKSLCCFNICISYRQQRLDLIIVRVPKLV